MTKLKRKIAMFMAIVLGISSLMMNGNVIACEVSAECQDGADCSCIGEAILGCDIEKEGASDLPIVNEAIVTARIMELARILEINEGNLNTGAGIQFTVNQGACGHATTNAGSCSNCLNTNIIKSDWFKQKFGYTLDVGLLPGHYYPSGNGSNVGRTCHGFVNFALWYIAKADSTSNVYRKLVGTQGVAFTKANLEAAGVRIGDVIRIGGLGHSVMFLGYGSGNTIKVLDCNWVNSVAADIATVKIHTMSLNSSYTMAITRATNYEPDSTVAVADTTKPVISNVKISQDSLGYTVTCTATDNVYVTQVSFPTWTEYNGQDDLAAEYWNTELGTRNGDTFTYRVDIADHNMELGNYITHIYAYDAAGNYSLYDLYVNVKEETLTEAFVGRMYTVALNRTADATGKANWVTVLNAGTHDGAAIAKEFILGQEFAMRGLSNDTYIDVLYQTFFDRNADATGKANWLNHLAVGYSREFVLSQFVNSEEFTVLCQSFGISRGVMFDNGFTANVGIPKFVSRLYSTVMGRSADSAGYTNWTMALATKQQSAEQVAKSFFTSQEYLNKDTNNTTFVTDLYRTFFDREPDTTGLTNWKNQLNCGMSRSSVIAEFANSAEFKALAESYGL